MIPVRTSERGEAKARTTGRTARVEQRHQDDRDRRVDQAHRSDARAGATPSRKRERRDEQGDDEALEQRRRPAAPLPQDADLGLVQRGEIMAPSFELRPRAPARAGGPRHLRHTVADG